MIFLFLYFSKSLKIRLSNVCSSIAGFKSIVADKQLKGNRLILEDAERTIGPETPKCVKSISPNSSNTVLSPIFTQKDTFFKAKPCKFL